MNRKSLPILFMMAMILIPLSFLSAQDMQDREFYNELLDLEHSDLLTIPQVGDYVIYKSNFGTNEMLLTIISLGNHEFFFKTFNMHNYEINKFKATLIWDGGEYRFSDFILNSGDSSSEQLKLALMESLSMFNARKDINTSEFPEAINTSVDWEKVDVTVHYNFRAWVPIVNMYNRTYKENQRNVLQLIRFGRLAKDREDSVLDFTGLDTSFDNSPTSEIKELPMNPTAFDGMNIPLDLNWTGAQKENTSEVLVDNQTYAKINIQTVPTENIDENSYLFLNKLILNNRKYILPESVDFFDFKGTPSLIYAIIDEETLKKSIVIIMLYDRGEYTSILSFSSYLNFYSDNKTYFNKILF